MVETNPHITKNLGKIRGLRIQAQVVEYVRLQALQAGIQAAQCGFLGLLVLFAAFLHLTDQLGERPALGIHDGYGMRSVL